MAENAREYVRRIDLECNLPDCEEQAEELVKRREETIAVCPRHKRLFPRVELESENGDNQLVEA